MRRDIIPVKDQEFHVFQDFIIPKMATNAVAWNIPAPVITELSALRLAWNAAWSAAKKKETRTPTQTRVKKDARKALTKAFRPALQLYVQRNPAVTDGDRVGMDIKPQSRKRPRINKPATVPWVTLLSGTGSNVHIHFSQEPEKEGTSHRGKPPGVKALEVYYCVGNTEPAGMDDYNKHAMATHSPLTLTFDWSLAGKRIYARARWLNPRLQPGPWSEMKTVVVPG